MTDEINQSPSSPMEGSPEESPMIAIHPSVEEKTNIMTLEELNALRDTYSFPSKVQVRLPDEGEIITSTRLGEVVFYKAAFPAGLRFPLHPTIRRGTKKVLLGGYLSNVKGWKSKFFFVSGDEWVIPEGTPREGIPRVPRTWGIPDKHYNNPPRLYGDESKVFEEIFRSVEQSGRFSVPVLLDSKSYRQVFVSPGFRASRTAGDNLPSREAPSSSSDVAMSKRVSFKKIGEKLGKTAGASSGTPVPAKGVVIGKKQAGESITSSPSKKGKANDSSKGKGVDSGPEGKKKATSSSKASAAPIAASSRPGEGTSANLGIVPGPMPSIFGSPSVAERLLRGVIPPADKEKVEKLTLDQTATKLFHALVLGSSLAVRSREAREQASLQEGRVASMETEANDKLAKMKSDRDSLTDKLERSGVLVNELREALNKANESVVEEFKSSSEFVVAVEDSASKYFGEGFSARCNFAGIILTLLSILKAPWSIKICWRSRTRLLRRTKGKYWARTRGYDRLSTEDHGVWSFTRRNPTSGARGRGPSMSIPHWANGQGLDIGTHLSVGEAAEEGKPLTLVASPYIRSCISFNGKTLLICTEDGELGVYPLAGSLPGDRR
ncbi:hypothetical protein Acr_06g0009940 [Actinidia rufa]|uniref:Uncharacterized protein n=1 Tax=Actinidia rufa TaxID=165716 RepID=A0A7J0ERD5_9ERIC|nr:hypothetical protein Acr_06g0009940 [Actinidia rufa]